MHVQPTKHAKKRASHRDRLLTLIRCVIAHYTTGNFASAIEFAAQSAIRMGSRPLKVKLSIPSVVQLHIEFQPTGDRTVMASGFQ